MEIWLLVIVTVCSAALIKSLSELIFSGNSAGNQKRHRCLLPPGPRTLPIIGNISWLGRFSLEVEANLRAFRAKFGPIVTVVIGSRPAIFICNRALAYQALVHGGATFADRPKGGSASRIMNSNRHSISSAKYGTTWRLLRRNLTSQILHLSQIKSYSPARKWVLRVLLDSLAAAGATVTDVMEHFQYAMFSLLVFMCFGDRLDEGQIRKIESIQRGLLRSFNRMQILNFLPWLSKIIFRARWRELLDFRKTQDDVLGSLIRARREKKQQVRISPFDTIEERDTYCYVDSLLELKIDDDNDDGGIGNKRELTESEIVTLCSEFLSAGTDTTSTALQWIMANLVKYPSIQVKLLEEMKSVVGEGAEEIKEDDLPKLNYLKGVVLEGLRRHPPGHFVLPHVVTEEVELGGYVVPKNAMVNFMVADIGLDPEVWEDPMAFKPERFLAGGDGGGDEGGGGLEAVVNCTKEIKMMPFGAGRRICPGIGLALLHLEYFVANLVYKFEWKVVDGEEVDFSEKQEFTIVMKHPLRAHLSPRPYPTNVASANNQ